jgi:uncharacterized protein involved in outer membrane biogenesis
MSESSNGPSRRGKDPGASFATPWVSPRRKRFWAVIALLVYTLGGFFAVPLAVEKLVTGTVRDSLDRTATIDRVRFNPFVLSLEVDGLELADRDGVQLAAFDRLFVNFQLSSLFRWAWTFRTIELDAPMLRFERFAAGDSRLTRLLADIEANAPPSNAQPEESGGLPRLLVQDVRVNRGEVRFRDDVPSEPVELSLGPVTVSVQELSTLPDRFGRQSVEVRLPDDARLSWQGSISLAPLETEGTLALENSSLHQTIAYLRAVLPLESMQARLSLRTAYRIEELDDGSLDLELDDIEADLTDLAVAGLVPATEFLTLPALTVRGGALRFPERELSLASVELTDPGLTAWLSSDGELSLLGLANTQTEAAGAETADEGEPENWQLRLDAFRIGGGRLDLTDNQVDPPAELAVEALSLGAASITNADGAEIPIDLSGALGGGGEFSFGGRVVALPDLSVAGTLRLSGISLSAAQPYVEQRARIRIEEGVAATTADLALGPDGSVTAAGNLEVNDLRVSALDGAEPLIGWKTLNIDRFEADLAAGTLGLSTVEFAQPYARVVINPDRTTNLDGLIVPTEPTGDEAAAATADEPALGLVIGGITVADGALDFSDLSLPLPFSTNVRGLEGFVSTVDTGSVEPARIRLEGQVGEYGLARIEGTMNPTDPIRHTDVSMEFRNLLMTDLSPYSAAFAGREIAAGKLDLDLLYRIEQGQLTGANDIVMSDLVLGDKVDSPDAASLPLGLAVALLKDADGVIDLDLPVEGDVNDPEFRIGGVIWKAFTSLITKIVSAPFRLLGNLIGVESEDMGQFRFLAGRFDLTPPEREKIVQLREALQQRPELSVAVAGAFDPAIDVPALQYARLRDAVMERIGGEDPIQEEEFRMLNDDIRGVLEAIFTERFPNVALGDVKDAHRAPPADDPEAEPVLDELAYAADLRDRLLAAEQITPGDLEALGTARAEAIRTAFLENSEFDAGRVVLEAPAASESEDGEWVVMELGVAAD